MNLSHAQIAFARTLLLLALGASALPTASAQTPGPAPSPPASTPAPSPSPPPSPIPNRPPGVHVPWHQPPPLSGQHPIDRDPVFQLQEVKRRWAEILRDDILPPFFLPPPPPALAARLPLKSPHPSSDEYPSELADFVGEIFYMPYGSLLQRDWFPPKRSERIEAYRLKRQQLLNALRTRLAETKDLSETERIAARRAFAASQEAALRALSAEAEGIRAELTSPGMFASRGEDGSALLGSAASASEPGTEHTLAIVQPIVAAYFYEGLSPDQRHLLEEISLEERIHAAASATPSEKPDHLLFSPATARIRLPAGLPPEAAAQLARYQAIKASLKDELRTAIARNDYLFVFQRTERFAQLAARQAPRFAEFEALAEQLRPVFARIPYVDAPPKSTLPPDLTRRVGLAVDRKTTLQRELTARYKTLRAEFGGGAVEIIRHGKALGLALTGEPRLSSAQRTRVATELATFNDDLRRRYLALDAEMETLRRDLQAHAAQSKTDAPHDVDRLAAEFNRSYAAQATWARFHDYYVATIEPGLSPLQRQLLYNAARSDLLKFQLKSSS